MKNLLAFLFMFFSSTIIFAQNDSLRNALKIDLLSLFND